eukprot:gene6515-1758_t
MHCDQLSCDARTGACKAACAAGWWGLAPGASGSTADPPQVTCDKQCNAASHCIDGGVCDVRNGLCTSGATKGGCAAGSWGWDDEHAAFACDNKCGHATHCADYPNCDGFTGLCDGGGGCADGWWGWNATLH